MVYTALLPKWWFRVRLTHASEEKQPQRGGKTLCEQLREKCPALVDPKMAYYTPPWMLSNGNLQTIYLYTQHFRPAGCPVEFEREIFAFEDGGIAALDWALPRMDVSPNSPVIVLIPGIAGTSHDYYSRSFIHRVSQEPFGYQVVVLHSRGINGVDLTTPKAFHGGMTEDLREYMVHLKQKYPSTPFVGVGFSLGANILAKYIGEEADSCPFAAAASVCNPYDIGATVNNMCLPTIKNRYLYASALTQSLLSLFRKNRKVILSGEFDLDAEEIEASQNINEFNEAYTAKVFGHNTAGELNASGNCIPHLRSIKIPMLFVNALDDPMCYKSTIPYSEFETNPNLVLACTRYGGHLAYFEGSGLTPWLPRQLAQFIQAMLEWR